MNIVARSLLCIGMGWAMSCAAQQPGTLDSSFAGDGVLHLDTSLHLTAGRFQVHDLGGGRYFILGIDQWAGGLTGAILVEDTSADTLLFESGPWFVSLSGSPRVDYVAGAIQSISRTDTSWHIERYLLTGALDTTFADSGSMTISLQGFAANEDPSPDECWRSITGEWYCSVITTTAGWNGTHTVCSLVKMDASGTWDPTFGSQGRRHLGIASDVESIQGLTTGGPLVWLFDGPNSPTDPPTDRFIYLDTNGIVLHTTSTSASPSFFGTDAWSLLLDQNDVAFFSAGKNPTHTRLCRSGIGESRVCYYDVYLPWEFPYTEYPAAYIFARDSYGGVYYTVDPGTASFHGHGRWFIARRHNDGSRDLAFGNIQIPFDDTYALKGGFVQGDGKIVTYGSGFDDHVVARYHNIPDPRAKLDLRLFLGGCWDPNTVLMHDSLRVQGLIPLQQPYPAPDFMPANGVGAGMTSATVLDESGPDAAVDWVWLDLLSAADTVTVVATRAGLVRRNGLVTSPINHDPIDFSVGAGSYFLRVRHRNHLGVTLSVPLALSDSVVSVDLTDPATATFGVQAQLESHGVHMLWPGDATSDRLVRYAGAGNDRDAVLVAIGGTPPTASTTGYLPADVNLDGVVKYAGADNERDLILQTIGGVQPTAVRMEQRP